MVLLQGTVFPSALHCQLLPIITCELISSLAADANLKSSAQPVSFALSSHPFVFLEVVPRLCIADFSFLQEFPQLAVLPSSPQNPEAHRLKMRSISTLLTDVTLVS